jgi:hypothetical protein
MRLLGGPRVDGRRIRPRRRSMRRPRLLLRRLPRPGRHRPLTWRLLTWRLLTWRLLTWPRRHLRVTWRERRLRVGWSGGRLRVGWPGRRLRPSLLLRLTFPVRPWSGLRPDGPSGRRRVDRLCGQRRNPGLLRRSVLTRRNLRRLRPTRNARPGRRRHNARGRHARLRHARLRNAADRWLTTIPIDRSRPIHSPAMSVSARPRPVLRTTPRSHRRVVDGPFAAGDLRDPARPRRGRRLGRQCRPSPISAAQRLNIHIFITVDPVALRRLRPRRVHTRRPRRGLRLTRYRRSRRHRPGAGSRP